MPDHKTEMYREMYKAVAEKWGALLERYDLDPDSSPDDVIEAALQPLLDERDALREVASAAREVVDARSRGTFDNAVNALADAYNAYTWPSLPEGRTRPRDLAEFVVARLDSLGGTE